METEKYNDYNDFQDSVFLNREGIIESIKLLFEEAVKEIIIIVPFIKISDAIWKCMKDAEKKNKEIILVYREDSMNASQKLKLESLNNITILNHPHIHAKCYINENEIIICSMNLYEYSEKHNREMGVKTYKYGFNEEVYYNALREVRAIISASTIEKKSLRVQTEGFKLNVLVKDEDKLRKYIDTINRIFVNKNFEIVSKNDYEPEIMCDPYIEKISAYLDYDIDEDIEVLIRRIRLKFNLDEKVKTKLHSIFWENYKELDLDQFRVFWYKTGDLTIYGNKNRYPQWKELNFEQNIKKLKQGLDKIINFIKMKSKNWT